MESWLCSCWIYLWTVTILFRSISADPASPLHYTVHRTQVNFDQAMVECAPGVLTTLATKQEVISILELVSKSLSHLNQNEFTFWVGLRKVKNECVVPTLPLRGFKWMEDGSEESQVSRWAEEPKHTCTTVRCAALKVELEGSTVTRWGLISTTCKNSYQFICKVRDRLAEGRLHPPKLATSEPEPATPEPNTTTPEPHKPESRPATRKPEPATPEPERSTQRIVPEADLKPTTGSELQGPDPGSEPAPGLDSCQHPLIPGARSLILDGNNSSRIKVECWSTIKLELHCSGLPTVWRLLDDSPANFTAICQPCEDGFQKDASGNCVDINECSSGRAPCRHTCLNTEGSYRCVCSDENGKKQDEDSAVCADTAQNGDKSLLSGILIPVLVAVAALVVLVVAVAVTVKCCLMRRSRKRIMKKAEKMALKSKSSSETADEKVAI